jgi:hypothetical protein
MWNFHVAKESSFNWERGADKGHSGYRLVLWILNYLSGSDLYFAGHSGFESYTRSTEKITNLQFTDFCQEGRIWSRIRIRI